MRLLARLRNFLADPGTYSMEAEFRRLRPHVYRECELGNIPGDTPVAEAEQRIRERAVGKGFRPMTRYENLSQYMHSAEQFFAERKRLFY